MNKAVAQTKLIIVNKIFMADEFDEEPGSESSSGIGHKPIRRGWNMNEGTKLLSEKKNVINRKVGSL